jgi:Xaa-Pro dipeptidase
MTTAFWLDLAQRLTQANFIFVTDILMEMRFVKGPEELAFVEKAGEIADSCYDAILKTAKVGRKEYEVFAAIEQALTSRGVNSPSFILLCSGPGPIFPYTPSSHRTLELNDTILEEISPCYGGYWVQWARPVTLGQPDKKIRDCHKLAMEVYQFIKETIKPGVTFEGLAKAANDMITKAGYTWMAPQIQIVGLDCTEMAYQIKGTSKKMELVSRPFDKRPFEPGSVIVNQPSVVTKDMTKGTLVIDTVIVTEKGCKTVSKAPLEYATI